MRLTGWTALCGLAILAFVGSGCATLLKGTHEQVMINSDPSGANVSINDQENGTTPYVANVPSSEDLHIKISKPGYVADDDDDDASFRWGYEIWSFIEFVIPMGIDMADGAAWGHNQTMVAAHLRPVTPAAAPTPALATPAPAAAAAPAQPAAAAPPAGTQHAPAAAAAPAAAP